MSTLMGRSLPYRSFDALALTAGLVFCWGCGGDEGIGTRYPVRGTVTYKGAPLEKGTINFQALTPEGRGASGDIQGGEYSLTTQTPGDGALPGKYRVSIIAREADFSSIQTTSKKQGGTLPSKKDLGKVFQKAKRLIPAKYESPAASGLDAEVKEQSNTFNYPLTDG
ncbi:hypothetical protein ACYOEI_27320 [Singulisphaera rosea]